MRDEVHGIAGVEFECDVLRHGHAICLLQIESKSQRDIRMFQDMRTLS
jgi:hypothetical protein